MAVSTFSATNSNSTFQFALQAALGAFSSETYTNAKKLSGTGIVGASAEIDPSTETFIGQARFFKPYSTQTVNVASVSDATEGSYQSYTSDFLTYVKTVRTHGAQEVNMQRVVSQQDGLAKIARDFGEVRAQDEHDAILAVLKGVAAAEAKAGAAISSFDIDAHTGGFFVDVNGADAVFGAGTNDLVSPASSSTGYGAILGENLFKALSLGFADYEPEFMYMITSPEVMTKLRVANLVDQTTVVEGNLEFSTIFGGKFRLIMTRADQRSTDLDSDNVDAASVKTTFLVKPGAIHMSQLEVPMPVEMDRKASAYLGGGTTDIWYRWGYVAHPMGYTVATGAQSAFASNAVLAGRNTFERKMDMLNLGILPIHHA